MLTEMEVFVEVKLDVSNLVARITEQDGKRVEQVPINPAKIEFLVWRLRAYLTILV
jgi:hypothetical protein